MKVDVIVGDAELMGGVVEVWSSGSTDVQGGECGAR